MFVLSGVGRPAAATEIERYEVAAGINRPGVAAGIDRQFAGAGIARSVAAAVAAFCLSTGTADVSADASKNPFAGNAEAAAEGKALYLKNGCYACHGHEAEGAVGPDLTDDDWVFAFSEQMVFNTISRGRKGTVMSPFKDQLQPDEIWKVVEFLVDANRKRKAKK